MRSSSQEEEDASLHRKAEDRLDAPCRKSADQRRRSVSATNSGLIGEECSAIWVIEPDARRPLPSASTRESLETTHIQVGLTACEANGAPGRVKMRTGALFNEGQRTIK